MELVFTQHGLFSLEEESKPKTVVVKASQTVLDALAWCLANRPKDAAVYAIDIGPMVEIQVGRDHVCAVSPSDLDMFCCLTPEKLERALRSTNAPDHKPTIVTI